MVFSRKKVPAGEQKEAIVVSQAKHQMRQEIVLCEPECPGFVHVPFNTSLLHTVLLAYPDDRILFLGEQEHIQWVRNTLAHIAPAETDRVTWETIPIPPHGLTKLQRMPHEFGWTRRVLKRGAEPAVRATILCSLSGTGLWALKASLYGRKNCIRVCGVIHGMLARLTEPVRSWNLLLDTRRAFALPHPRQLTYLVLGQSIHDHLKRVRPRWAGRFQAMDHPYFWQMDHASPGVPAEHAPVWFGHFGVVSPERLAALSGLCSEVHAAAPSAQFILVGFVLDSKNQGAVSPVIQGVGRTPLSREEFTCRAADITYAVWVSDPNHYGLTASGTFLDTLSYVKPGIFLKNPYVEHYFSLLGDIGYLCDTYEDMRNLMVSLAQNFPKERYRQQCENILRGRHIFEPETLAARMREIVDAL